MNYEIEKFEGMQAVIVYPKGYEPNKRYPMILGLHGAGTRGNDPSMIVTGSAYLEKLKQMDEFPFISILPQCHADTWFDLWETLMRFFVHCCERADVDAERVYLIGASMGGYATWQLAMSLPERVAAIVPICGGGMYWNAGRLKEVPVWAFHGALDTTVLVEESEKMVNAVNRKGGKAKLTIYPENGHNAWDDTYGNPKVYEWMLQHSLEGSETNTERLNQKEFG